LIEFQLGFLEVSKSAEIHVSVLVSVFDNFVKLCLLLDDLDVGFHDLLEDCKSIRL